MSFWNIGGLIGGGGSGGDVIGWGIVGSAIGPARPLRAARSIDAITRLTRNGVVILLVSGATKYPRSDTVGHLIVPRQNPKRDALDLRPGQWAMDNGGFHGFAEGPFMTMLERFYGVPGCLFVTAPDVPYDAAATLDRWPFWSKLIQAIGFAPAFVAQNGLTGDRVPWAEIGALFIGGDDAYKEGPEARTLCAYAKARGVWVHWGRVNGQRRYAMAQQAGVNSIDGTGFSWYPDTRIPMVEQWREAAEAQPSLLR